MRYRLRTLLIFAAIGPPLLAAASFAAFSFAEDPRWEDCLPLVRLAASLATLMAMATLIVGVGRLGGSAR